MRRPFFFAPPVLLMACGPTAEPTSERSSAANAPAGLLTPKTAAKPAVSCGVYQGVLPCSDCAGIETQLYLWPDSTYLLRRTYLGKSQVPADLEAGRWRQHEQLQLTSGTNTITRFDNTPEGGLLHLDADGRRINSKLAEHYRLARVGSW